MDYAMPRADDLPTFKLDTNSARLHAQPAGHQGLRRGGRHRLAAGGDQRGARCAARLGVKDLDMPASPPRVWEAIQRATR
jgi:carbon-monoxide dehydrogenase large subunit